jgi:hypothetical protein
MCVRRWRLHYISAWATIFPFEATLFRRGHDQSASLKRMADRSGLAGIMQEHIEATVCAGHSSPRRFRRSDSSRLNIWARLAVPTAQPVRNKACLHLI